MDFVNKAYAQLVELFRSLSPGARIATAALLVLVVVSLIYLFQYQVTGGDELLLDGRQFSTSELKEIEAAFAKAGLGKSTVLGNRIRIPRGQKEAYLAAMADGNALPADFCDTSLAPRLHGDIDGDAAASDAAAANVYGIHDLGADEYQVEDLIFADGFEPEG